MVERVIIEMREEVRTLSANTAAAVPHEKGSEVRQPSKPKQQTQNSSNKQGNSKQQTQESSKKQDSSKKPESRKRYNPTKICKEYRAGHTCEGGKQCPKGEHPIKCLNILRRNICKHGGDCWFWHPTLCVNSTRMKRCDIIDCPKWHMKGTIKPENFQNTRGEQYMESSSEPKQKPTRERAYQRRERNPILPRRAAQSNQIHTEDNHFLDMREQLLREREQLLEERQKNFHLQQKLSMGQPQTQNWQPPSSTLTGAGRESRNVTNFPPPPVGQAAWQMQQKG